MWRGNGSSPKSTRDGLHAWLPLSVNLSVYFRACCGFSLFVFFPSRLCRFCCIFFASSLCVSKAVNITKLSFIDFPVCTSSRSMTFHSAATRIVGGKENWKMAVTRFTALKMHSLDIFLYSSPLWLIFLFLVHERGMRQVRRSGVQRNISF